jgi:hypothetical protein
MICPANPDDLYFGGVSHPPHPPQVSPLKTSSHLPSLAKYRRYGLGSYELLALSYPEPVLRAVNGARRGVLAKSKPDTIKKRYPAKHCAFSIHSRIMEHAQCLTGYHVFMVSGLNFARASCRALLTARKKGFGYENGDFGLASIYCGYDFLIRIFNFFIGFNVTR